MIILSSPYLPVLPPEAGDREFGRIQKIMYKDGFFLSSCRPVLPSCCPAVLSSCRPVVLSSCCLASCRPIGLLSGVLSSCRPGVLSSCLAVWDLGSGIWDPSGAPPGSHRSMVFRAFGAFIGTMLLTVLFEVFAYPVAPGDVSGN